MARINTKEDVRRRKAEQVLWQMFFPKHMCNSLRMLAFSPASLSISAHDNYQLRVILVDYSHSIFVFVSRSFVF